MLFRLINGLFAETHKKSHLFAGLTFEIVILLVYFLTMRLAFVAAAVKVGLLLPLFTANAEMYTYVSWITWWMVGYSVYAYSRLQSQSNLSLT